MSYDHGMTGVYGWDAGDNWIAHGFVSVHEQDDYADATDPTLWVPRLERMCAERAWGYDVGVRLGREWYEEDFERWPPFDGWVGAEITDERLAQAIWLLTVGFCREDFPPGVIEEGPRGL